MANKKTQIRRVQGIESVRELSDDIVGQFDPKKTWEDTWNQILGISSSGDSEFKVTDPFTDQKNEVFNASKHQNSEQKHVEKAQAKAEAAVNYHGDMARSSEKTSKMEMREINQRLQEIMGELQRIVNSSKVLQMEFAGVSVDQAPEQAGEYHLNFFDWLLLTIRAARQKVEDSGAWLATSKKKGNKKGGGYWDMFKKHGTSFGLSNERSVATQTG